jgi:PAS domain S-box-containing protein
MFPSIRTKILTFQAGLVLFVSGILGVSSYFLMAGSLTKSQQATLQFIAASQAERLSASIQNRGYLFERLVRDDAVKKYSQAYHAPLLTELFYNYRKDFPVLAFVDENGLETLKMVDGEIVHDLSDVSKNKIFQNINRKRQKVHTSLRISGDAPKDANLEFGFYRQNYFDEFEGAIIGRIPISNMFKDIETFKHGKTGFLMLLDKTGTILSHPQQDMVLRNITAKGKQSEKIVSQAVTMRSGSGRATILGIDGYLAFVPVKDYNWAVIDTMPYDEFMAAPRAMRKAFMVVSFLVLTIGIVISQGIANTIAKPIRKLTLAASRIAGGDLSQRVEISTRDEIGTLGQAFDKMVDNLQKSNRKLLESRERLATTLKSIGDGIIVTDSTGKVILMNPVAEQLTGWKEREALGKNSKKVFSIFNRDTGDRLESPVTKMLDDGKAALLADHTLLIAKDGTNIPVENSGTPVLNDKGCIMGTVLVFRDVSTRIKALEQIVHAREAAEAANFAKSEFLANMSHELRTPLNHIIGFSELIADKHFGDLNETQEEYLNDVLQSSRHLLSLINDILDLSKVEAGKLELKLSEIDLKELIEHSRIMFKEKATANRINLSTELDGVPEFIRADERKLKQILYNLLSNSVKFTPKGGSIVISAKQIPRTDGQVRNLSASPINYIQISVEDTGIGLKEKDLNRIFFPFEQVDGSATRRYQGTGLGLSLTKKLVELHGGRIWAQSEGEGKGAIVSFVLPVVS